jgi:hypothetical protein
MDPVAPTTQKLSTYTPQNDSAKYIRTYAKDVAMLTKTEQPAAPQQPAAPAPAAEEAKVFGVSLPTFDPSPVNHTDPASAKEYKQEAVELSSSDSNGIFKSPQAPAPTPLMPQASVDVIPTVAPVEDAPASETPSREEVLARLRSKLDAKDAAPEQSTPEEISDPLRTGAPDFSSFDTSWIPTPPPPIEQPTATPPAPVPTPVPAPESVPSPLHTYSSDFADKIDTDQSSTFSVLAAQSDAGQSTKAAPARKRNLVPLIAGVAMLVIGVIAVVGAYAYMHGQTNAPIAAQDVPSVIRYDEAIEVKGSGDELLRDVANVGQGGSVSGNVVVTYVTGISSSDGSHIPQPGAELIKRLNLSAPSILLRNIQDESTVGVVNADSQSHPFMILKVNSYERTFAGMLAWEQTLPQELETWYPVYSSLPTQDQASTTPVVVLQSNPGFVDAVVANNDVRILRDASGRSLMLYGYHGKDTLIIARDEAAFTALISRLGASGQ